MKTPSAYPNLILLILLFSFGCSQVSQRKLVSTETAKSTSTEEPEKSTEVIATQPKTSSNDEPGEEPKTNDVAEASENTSFNLMDNILQSVDRLKGTPYSRELKNDCSGIFHQVLDGMRDQAPNAIFPTIKNARTSRAIAAWYAKKGHFSIVRDPASQGDLIKPGMVMFYGHGDSTSHYNYRTMTIDTLKARKIGINHVAIVLEIHRDKNNVLQSYTIFHGRNVGKNAGVTISQKTYQNHPELPAYGNWLEPWLAIAEIVTEKK